MANRRISSRHIRGLFAYSVAEAAQITGVHRNTIHHWLKSGLVAIDSGQPILIKGAALKAFIESRRARRRRPCGPGRIFCLKCREPKRPAFGEVEYEADNGKLGRLIGLCPECGTIILRRTSERRLRDAAGDLGIRFRPSMERLDKLKHASLNCEGNRA
jgi:excisionase family DNA binding protein